MKNKVFLDTCIWMELCVLSNPQNSNEISQNRAATNLLRKLLKEKAEIVSIDYQLIELMQVIMKTKMKECSRYLKDKHLPGISNIKDFRKNTDAVTYLNQAKMLCKSTIRDIKMITKTIDHYKINEDLIIDELDKLDVMDSTYYRYCRNNNAVMYTFDKDFDFSKYQDDIKVIS